MTETEIRKTDIFLDMGNVINVASVRWCQTFKVRQFISSLIYIEQIAKRF